MYASKITFLKLKDIFCNEGGKAPRVLLICSQSTAIQDAESL